MKKFNRRDFLHTSLTATAGMAVSVVGGETVSASSVTKDDGHLPMRLSGQIC